MKVVLICFEFLILFTFITTNRDNISRTAGTLLIGNQSNSTKCDVDRLKEPCTNRTERNGDSVTGTATAGMIIWALYISGFVVCSCIVASSKDRPTEVNLNASATIKVPTVGYRATMICMDSDLPPVNNITTLRVDSDLPPAYNSVKPMAELDELPNYSEAIKMQYI